MHRRGFRRMYEFIGFTDWSEALRWGYLCSQINLSRYNWPKHPVYGKKHTNSIFFFWVG